MIQLKQRDIFIMTQHTATFNLTFDKSAQDFVINAFNKKVDEHGYIVEKDSPSTKVLSRDGQEIKASRFGGVRKGSEIYFKSDLISVIELCEDLRKK